MITGNEPAFPFEKENQETLGSYDLAGVTIRQYYAGLAMAAYIQATESHRESFISKIKRFFGISGVKMSFEFNSKRIAECSVEMANDLITALNKDQ